MSFSNGLSIKYGGASKCSQDGKKKQLSSRHSRQEPEVKQFVEPTDKDVLFGRGGKSNNHPGNKLYRDELEILKPIYAVWKGSYKNKNDMTELAQLIVDTIRDRGGRFLQRDDDGKYFMVTNAAARRKASQALREANTPASRKAKREKYERKSKSKRISHRIAQFKELGQPKDYHTSSEFGATLSLLKSMPCHYFEDRWTVKDDLNPQDTLSTGNPELNLWSTLEKQVSMAMHERTENDGLFAENMALDERTEKDALFDEDILREICGDFPNLGRKHLVSQKV